MTKKVYTYSILLYCMVITSAAYAMEKEKVQGVNIRYISFVQEIDGTHIPVYTMDLKSDKHFYKKSEHKEEGVYYIGVTPEDFATFPWEQFFGKEKEALINPPTTEKEVSDQENPKETVPFWKKYQLPFAGTILLGVCTGYCAALAIATNK